MSSRATILLVSKFWSLLSYDAAAEVKYGGVEMNLASNATATREGKHPGYEPTALEGLTMSLDVIAEKKIKVVINGGSLRPKALAEKVHEMVCQLGLPDVEIC